MLPKVTKCCQKFLYPVPGQYVSWDNMSPSCTGTICLLGQYVPFLNSKIMSNRGTFCPGDVLSRDNICPGTICPGTKCPLTVTSLPYMLTCSISLIDTIILYNGVTRFWSLSTIQPVDSSGKRFTVLEKVTVANLLFHMYTHNSHASTLLCYTSLFSGCLNMIIN